MIPLIKNFKEVIEGRNIDKMNKELYEFLTLSCGFIAHYNIEGFKATYTFSFKFSGELSLDKDTTSGSREKELTADVVNFQVTQSLVDFINVQTQSGPHFRLEE